MSYPHHSGTRHTASFYCPAMKMTLLYIMLAALMTACGNTSATSATEATNDSTATTSTTAGKVQFDGNAALNLAQQQCAFGPRVPGTPAHAKCAEWLTTTLKASCDTVMVQTGTVQTAKSGPMGIKNIIGIINPDASQRLLLLAHWDTRPWADNDPDGIDIVLVDVEDMGENDNEDSWGLGTQFWAEHPHKSGYKPLFGILLDMVGSSDATFTREYYSTQYAGGFVDLVWNCAAGNHFINAQGGAVTDDHIFVNRAGIPCVDIIDLRSDSDTGFCPEWHTIHDTMDAINPATLTEVGQTLLNVIAELEK